MSQNPYSGKMVSSSHPNLGLALGLAGVVIFGATLPMTRIALEAFSPWFVTFARAAMASMAAAACLIGLRRRFPKRDAPYLFLAGICLVFGFPGLTALAMKSVPAAHGGVVLAILPLSTSIFAVLFAGERPSATLWTSCVAGTGLVAAFAVGDSGMQIVSGDIWLIGAAISASLGYVISGKLSRSMPGWEVICWALALTSPMSFVLTAATFDPAFAIAPPAQIAALCYLAFGSMFLGFFAWNMGLALGGIARTSQVQLLQTFVTIAFSALLLGEKITTQTLLCAVALAAIVAIGRSARLNH
jgi:drug/metabolite transporter (DMT)-like permease